MNRSDFQEVLVALYLRLNGYFVSGFIAHAPQGNLTEIDSLAVRFPRHQEPEVEMGLCPYLQPPTDRVEFLVGEVKGGEKNAKFNPKFREQKDAIQKVLWRIGAFSKEQVAILTPQIIDALKPEKLTKHPVFPSFPIDEPGMTAAQLRFVLFSPDQVRHSHNKMPVIFGDDMLRFIWERLHPARPRAQCAVNYNRMLWGHQFNALVAYFKDQNRSMPGTVADLYQFVVARNASIQSSGSS